MPQTRPYDLFNNLTYHEQQRTYLLPLLATSSRKVAGLQSRLSHLAQASTNQQQRPGTKTRRQLARRRYQIEQALQVALNETAVLAENLRVCDARIGALRSEMGWRECVVPITPSPGREPAWSDWGMLSPAILSPVQITPVAPFCVPYLGHGVDLGGLSVSRNASSSSWTSMGDETTLWDSEASSVKGVDEESWTMTDSLVGWEDGESGQFVIGNGSVEEVEMRDMKPATSVVRRKAKEVNVDGIGSQPRLLRRHSIG